MGKKSLDDDDVSIWKKVTETVNPILRRRFGKAEFEATEILESKTQPTPKKKTAQNAAPAEQKPATAEQKIPSSTKKQTVILLQNYSNLGVCDASQLSVCDASQLGICDAN